MKKTALLFCIPLLLAAFSCVSEFTARVPENEYDLLVVEGDIIGDSLLQFSFSKNFSLNEDRPPAGYDDVLITDLAVIGSDGYRSAPATASGKGIYRLSMGKLDEDVAYGVEFKYEGNTYRSELMKPLRTPAIDSVSWSQPIQDGEVMISVSTHDEQEGTCYYMWRYVEDWEITSPYQVFAMYDPETDKFYNLTGPNPYYYCWVQHSCDEILIGSTAKLNQNLIIDRTLIKRKSYDSRFTVLYCVYVEQQAISKAGYEYYMDVLKGNIGMGGLFTPMPSQIEGNITCLTDERKKVIGHIEVTQNVSISPRIFISCEEITKPPIDNKCEVLDKSAINKLMMEKGKTYLQLYKDGYRVIDWTEETGPRYMTIVGCADCRERGTKTKPSFWPNDHE